MGTLLYQEAYEKRRRSASEAVAGIANGETLLVGMSAGQPPALLAAIADRVRANDLKGLRLYYKIAMQPLATTLLAEDVLEKLDAHTFFVGGPDRQIEKVQAQTHIKRVSFVPANFSQIPRLVGEHIPVETFVVTV